MAADEGLYPADWLGDRISVERAEADHPGITDERVTSVPSAGRAFGFRNGEWERLKADMKPGDEIWTFGTPKESWEDLAGRAGIALVRDGRIIAVIVTMMN